MRQRKQKRQILSDDLVKYSKQIGIPARETPTILWDKRTFAKLTGSRKKAKSVLGCCSFTHNTVMVDLEAKGLGLRSARNTLVHELVHMRWQKKAHGRAFNKRIHEIFRGAKFPLRTKADEQPYYKIEIKGTEILEPTLPRQFQLIPLQW